MKSLRPVVFLALSVGTALAFSIQASLGARASQKACRRSAGLLGVMLCEKMVTQGISTKAP